MNILDEGNTWDCECGEKKIPFNVFPNVCPSCNCDCRLNLVERRLLYIKSLFKEKVTVNICILIHNEKYFMSAPLSTEMFCSADLSHLVDQFEIYKNS